MEYMMEGMQTDTINNLNNVKSNSQFILFDR